jgi:hypothetical protein
VENERMKQPRSRFRNYLSLEALVIFGVLVCFQVIPDKKAASIVASLLFLSSSILILYWETRFADFKKRPSFWGTLIFLVVSVLPIFALRLVYWEIPFDQIQMGPVTGAEMHKASNYLFMMMMICFFVDAHLERVKQKENAMFEDR